MMARLRVGLIGVGKHGSRYARHLARDFPDIALAALARRNLEAARAQASEYGCRAYGDYRELIADGDIDAIIVVVPPTAHPGIIEAAAAAKKPVLLEKPAAPNVAAGRTMLRAAARAGIPVMVAQTLRYNGIVRLLLAERAQIGKLHAVRLSQDFEPSRPGWIDDPAIAGGGITLHTGVHSFDLLRIFTDLEVDHVSCAMSAVRTQHSEDNFSAVMRLGDGAVLASIGGSRATASRSGIIELIGAGGHLIGDHVLNTAAVVHGSVVSRFAISPPLATVREVIRDFAHALQREQPMPIPLTEGLRAVAIAEACYEAARSGRAVPVAHI